jgi:branched-chain amino acid transport system permease protein
MDSQFTGLFLNAMVSGLLLGGFFAAMSVGVSISFGMLDIVNIAHPAFIILGSYLTYLVFTYLGLDPLLAMIVLIPVFFILGLIVYKIYYHSFEKHGSEPLRGLAFFFGLLFIIEVSIVLTAGVDYRTIGTSYTDTTLTLGEVDLPLRLVLPFIISMMMALGIRWFLSKTYFGRAVSAVAQDSLALQLMGVNPVKVKSYAFAISIVTAGIGGALLIIIQSVQPSMGRDYIGLVFAICVLGGLGSLYGTLLGAFILGIAEAFTATFAGPSWAPAVSFGLLLLTLAFRPSGIFGR